MTLMRTGRRPTRRALKGRDGSRGAGGTAMDSVRVGVIGTGIGVAHIEALRQVPGAEVAAVCSAQRARAAAIAARFGVPRATDDYRELLSAGLDAVVLATPPTLHAPMALAALAVGLHVVCEK